MCLVDQVPKMHIHSEGERTFTPLQKMAIVAALKQAASPSKWPISFASLRRLRLMLDFSYMPRCFRELCVVSPQPTSPAVLRWRPSMVEKALGCVPEVLRIGQQSLGISEVLNIQ